MSLFHLFTHGKKWITAYGKKINDEYKDKCERESTYEPRFNGQWINKGTRDNEKWVWEDKVKRIRPVYVNIFEVGEDDYIITMGNSARPDAIDSTECMDEWGAGKLMKNLGLYYECIGKVTIVKDLQQ